MKPYHRRCYYQDAAPISELVQFLTDGGAVPLEAVELGTRFEHKKEKPTDERSFGMRRRNNAYYNDQHMRAEFVKRVPCSVEVGAILPFTVPEEFRHIGVQAWRDFMFHKDVVDQFNVTKMLVFDWDIDVDKRAVWNTQNSIKCRCKKKQVCSYCWAAFAEPARMALLRVLRHWMGYKHVVCVFSGRRGFHTWVLDEGTRSLTQQQRKTIFEKVAHPIVNGPMYDDVCSILEPYRQKYHSHYLSPTKEQVWEIFYILDDEPTTQLRHFVGVPLFTNAYTGVLRLPIEVHDYDPTRDSKTLLAVNRDIMQRYVQHFNRRDEQQEEPQKKKKK